MLKIQKLVFNPFQENTYIVWDDADASNACAIIDPGCMTSGEKAKLDAFIAQKGLKPAAILLTHAHLDHIMGVQHCIEKYGIPVYMDSREEQTITGFNPSMIAYGLPDSGEFPYNAVGEGDEITVGQREEIAVSQDAERAVGALKFRALRTPGHSFGGLCWWNEPAGVIFTGDTLFAGAIGRTDNKWADWSMLKASIKSTLMALDGTVDVFPGHGPATSIGQERLTNPFIVDEFGPEGFEA